MKVERYTTHHSELSLKNWLDLTWCGRKKSLVATAVMASMVCLSGCSFLTIGVPLAVEEPGQSHPRCQYRYFPAGYDVIAGAATTAILIALLARPHQCLDNPSRDCGGPSWVPAALEYVLPPAILYDASAAYGIYEVADCERELQRMRLPAKGGPFKPAEENSSQSGNGM